MTKIYAIFEGDYSGYHHVASFSTKEKADAFSIAIGLGPNEWDEIELDNPLADHVANGLTLWNIHMKRDGTVDFTEQKRISPYYFESNWHVNKPGFMNPKMEPHLIVWCFARDKEHAIKIAGEHRTRSIVEGHWEAPKPPEPIGEVKDIERLPGGGISIKVELKGKPKE